ncbi:two-component system sensor histidine kinase, partial [gut metagenome]
MYREDMLESRLRSYADLVAEALESDGLKTDSTRFYSIASFLPEELRLTVISRQGSVMYESSEQGAAEMDSHQDRPEVQNALLKIEGNDIRKSITTGLTYYYYAKSYGSFLVRVALP